MKKHSIKRHAIVLWLFVLALAQPSFGQEETGSVTEVVPPTNATTLDNSDNSKEVSQSNMPESVGDSPVLNTREVILLYAASIGGAFASVLSLLNWLAQRKAVRALANFFDANDFDVRHNNLIQQITDIDNDWKRTQKILNGEIQKLASQLPKDPATNAQIEKLNKVSIAIKQNLVEVKEIVDTMKSNQERASFQGQFDFPGADGIAASEKGIGPTGVSKNSRDQFVIENQRLETRNRELEESVLRIERLIEESKNREIELKRRADSDREKSDRIISEQSDRYSSELREASERIAKLEKQLESIDEGQKKKWLHSFNSEKNMKPLKEAIEGFLNEDNTAALLVVNSMHTRFSIRDGTDTSAGFELGALKRSDGMALVNPKVLDGLDGSKFSLRGNTLIVSDGVVSQSRKSKYNVKVLCTEQAAPSFIAVDVVDDQNVKREGDQNSKKEIDQNSNTKGDQHGSTKGDQHGSTKGDQNGSTKGDQNGNTKGDQNGNTKGDQNGNTKGDQDLKPKQPGLIPTLFKVTEGTDTSSGFELGEVAHG